jgi:MULE transposase domain
VTFDTTYNTNKYCMPLGFFTGVNHHWQSIVFGCALLRNEQANNFSWLFRTWMEAMYNKAPISIITDQDPAMRVAIQDVWPETVHRCCQWHIMRKTREKLLFHYDTDKSFKKKLENVVNRSLTVVDFERSWKKMIKEHALELLFDTIYAHVDLALIFYLIPYMRI